MSYDIYGQVPDMSGRKTAENDSKNTFADALRMSSSTKLTENGAHAFSTTGGAVVDLFATIGALRNGDNSLERLRAKIDAAWAEDPLMTMRCLFYARDIRGGLGEREIFRKAVYYCAMAHTDEMRKNITLIPEYGRWDDLFALIGTPLEENMWRVIRTQLAKDTFNAANGDDDVSLCAKWMPSIDTSSKKTVNLAKYCALNMGMSQYTYKRYIRFIRKHLRLLEQDMSAKRWEEIDYQHLPSQAHMRHTKAFFRNDEARYRGYLENVTKGEAKVNTGTLFPYELVERLYSPLTKEDIEHNKAIETMWRNLPDYVRSPGNILVVADTSGSMYGRPMAVSTSLAIYFAERNRGPFANMYMTFSERPEVIEIAKGSLYDKYKQVERGPWGQSTNLYAVFDFLAYIAYQTKCRPEDMPKSVVIITDMEIDRCESVGAARWNTIVDKIAEKYHEMGYEMPNLVFWNVASRQDTFLARSNRKGVQMVSGSSAGVFKAVLGFANGMTPYDAVKQVLNAERYQAITI